MDELQAIESLGLKVVPIPLGQKYPSLAGWPDLGRPASSLDESVEVYGVLCDGITVVDFDPRNMGVSDSDYHIEFLCEMYGLNATFSVKTGGGGLHLYYLGESPPGKMAPGVDIKSGHGHQVVGPGSVHPSGGVYEILVNTPMISTPVAVSQQRRSDDAPLFRAPVVDTTLRDFQKGERNDMLFRHLAKMRSQGVGDNEMRLYAHVANKANVVPPLSLNEVDILIAQVLKYEPGNVLQGLDFSDIEDIVGDRKTVPDLATLEELIDFPQPEFLVDGLLPSIGVGQMFGASYAGKTFVALDLGLSLSFKGQEWMGHALTTDDAVPVLYIAMEGGFDISQRAQSWCIGHDSGTAPNALWMVEKPFNIMSNNDMKGLMEKLNDANFSPKLVIIDTQTLASPLLDENSNSDMTGLMSRMKTLSNTLGCFVLLVHHTGHGADGRARGASAQFANLDVSIRVNKPTRAVKDHSVEFKKIKFGPLPQRTDKFFLKEAGQSVYASYLSQEEIAHEEFEES